MAQPKRCRLVIVAVVMLIESATYAQFNPSILQDSRDLPKTDGTFGFLYRTEDGIAHAAKGDPDGVIHGRFSYTDPTGLKVNYNYNAGSRVAPGYNYDAAPVAPSGDAAPRYEPRYEPARTYDRPQPKLPPSYQEPDNVYQQRRTRPPYTHHNDIYRDYNN